METMRIVAKIVITALSLLLVERLLPGVSIDSFYTALIIAIVLGLLNLVVRPVLILLTLPITILTLGLFIFIINASLFYFVSTFVDGFEVTSLWQALLGSVVVSVMSTAGQKLIPS
jgi:putative membrane protein